MTIDYVSLRLGCKDFVSLQEFANSHKALLIFE
jgi:hypothetical protein